ncbi:MAG: sec-independent protein translocase protein TatC [Polyangiales bacterium]|jgi:sec-independent protein translocase protein TatC
MSEEATVPENDVEMGFFEHIGELRTRLVHAIYGILPAAAICFYFVEYLFEWIRKPLSDAYAGRGMTDAPIHFSNLTDPFVAQIKISLVCGILLAAPWVFYQVWAFIAPGLYRKEKLLAIPFILCSTICFAGGAFFGYTIVFPLACDFLLSVGEDMGVEATIMITDYLSLTTRLLLAFGVVFEIPVVITILSVMGVVTGRSLLKFGRWWLLISTLVAAFLTPPDVGTQLLMLIPLVGLYFGSVGIAFIIDWRRSKKKKKNEEA